MRSEMTLVEQLKWAPVHDATTRIGEDGLLILQDGKAFDWHLLRRTDSRFDGVRIHLTIVAMPAPTCNTNIYVHHWGDKDVCSIDKSGAVMLDEGAEAVHVEPQADGFLKVTIVFVNRHPTLSVGTGTPRGKYSGTGQDQYIFKSIEIQLSPLNVTRQSIVEKLWKGRDPFLSIPNNLFKDDLQGWNSQHPYLSESIAALRPTIILEIGVWKGASTIFMANELKKKSLSSLVIAVDTWLGSSEHWTGPYHPDLKLLNGYPAIYYNFLANVLNAGVADYVIPMPIDSLNAAQIVKSLEIQPNLIHLDGGHDYDSVRADLRAWWPLLAPGGVLIGDDYFLDGMWESVRKAFDDFFDGPGLPIENQSGKCRIRKPKPKE